MPTALVIGSSSFVGQHLCRRLLSHQLEVIGADKSESSFTDKNFHFLSLAHSSSSLKRILRCHYVFCVLDNELSFYRPPFLNALLRLAQKHLCKFTLILIADVRFRFLSAAKITDYLGSPTPKTPSLLELARAAQACVARFAVKHQLDCRLLRLIDLYGPGMNLSASGSLPALLRAARDSSISLPSAGFQLLYPVFISDAIEAIMKATFSSSGIGRLFTLAHPQPISQIDFAYTLRHHFSHKITLATGEQNQKVFKLPASVFTDHQLINWQPTTPLDSGLSQTIRSLPESLPQTKTSPPPPTKLQPLAAVPSPKPLPPTNPAVRRGKWGLILIFLILSPFLISLGSFVFGSFTLLRAKNNLLAGKLNLAQNQLTLSQQSFTLTGFPLSAASQALSLIRLDFLLLSLESRLSALTNVSQAGLHLINTINSLQQLTQIIIGRTSGSPPALISAFQAEITRAYELLSFAQTDLPTNSRLGPAVSQLRQATGFARTALDLLPELIGADGSKKTYLLLLQNNAELRPTGGFIGSFALVTFESSRVLDFVVEDVYSADGQLKGHVEPPTPIKKYLGEANWFLRDSNWDPDFPSSARQAQWFLAKEINKKVDGVIALNLYAVQDLIRTTGDLDLPDFQETITPANLFERAQSHSEINFFPGSTQKKDFLSALANQLYYRFQNLDSHEFIPLASSLYRSLTHNQLFLYFNSPDHQALLEQLDLSGSLLDSQLCLSTLPCFTDYLGIFEANVGVNKANYFLRRQLAHQLNLDAKPAVATTTINYLNTSTSEAWPGGTYKTYLRFFVPSGSRLEQIKINDKNLSKNQVDISSSHQKSVFGFYFTVTPQATATVTVTYSLPFSLDLSPTQNHSQYYFQLQKQSGIDADPFNFYLSFPDFLRVSQSDPVVTTTGNTALIQTDLSINRLFSLELSR